MTTTREQLARAIHEAARLRGWHIIDKVAVSDREILIKLRADTEAEPGAGRPDPA